VSWGLSPVDLVGVGPILAARILGEVGDVARFPDADHFAAANGTAPIPVASGRSDRHRLNRGGNRRLNRALHYVALTQASFEPRGRLPGPQAGRRQDPPRGPSVPQTTAIHRRLQRHRRRPQATPQPDDPALDQAA
jgi:Transposase IS116/IS110/IS902 family